MLNVYIGLDYDEYKALEDQLRRWDQIETTHTTTDMRFYHKALRLKIGDTMFEFQGPLVMAPTLDDQASMFDDGSR